MSRFECLCRSAQTAAWARQKTSPCCCSQHQPLNTLPLLLALPCHLSCINATITHSTAQPHQAPGCSQHLFGDREEGTDLSVPPMKGHRVLLEMSGCKDPDHPSSSWPSAPNTARHTQITHSTSVLSTFLRDPQDADTPERGCSMTSVCREKGVFLSPSQGKGRLKGARTGRSMHPFLGQSQPPWLQAQPSCVKHHVYSPGCSSLVTLLDRHCSLCH